ncbi:MAG: leucine-rich repeat protein [Verrucomicrobiota bacterium]
MKPRTIVLCLWIALVALLAPWSLGQAQDFTWETNYDGSLTITGYTGTNCDVIIPDEIDGIPVLVIGHSAFAGTPLTSVVIPQTVTTLRGGAFSYTSLTNITIPNSVTDLGFPMMGGGTFQNCTNLTTVQLSTNLTYISPSTFLSCSSLRSIVIPDNVVSVGGGSDDYNGAFENCTSLTNVVFGSNVQGIGLWTFWGCSNLTSVHLPDSLIYIGDAAFCFSGLTTIDIPGSVYRFGGGDSMIMWGSFSSCPNLRSVKIREGVTRISAGAFAGDYNLVHVELPNSAAVIENSVFAGCTNLQDISLPNNLSEIDGAAFLFCDLRTVSIPKSVIYIGAVVFAGNSNLSAAYFHGDTHEFGNNDSMFIGDSNAVAYYLPGAEGWDEATLGIPTMPWTWPTATNLPAATSQDQPCTIAVEKLLLLASAPEGDALSLALPTNTTSQGGTVTLSGGAITYSPPTNYVGGDSIDYTVTDDWGGGTATAQILIDVLPADSPTLNMLPPIYTPAGVTIRFAGIVGRAYSVQRAPSPSGPWETIGTSAVGPSGEADFTDPNPPTSAAFYRTCYP